MHNQCRRSTSARPSTRQTETRNAPPAARLRVTRRPRRELSRVFDRACTVSAAAPTAQPVTRARPRPAGSPPPHRLRRTRPRQRSSVRSPGSRANVAVDEVSRTPTSSSRSTTTAGSATPPVNPGASRDLAVWDGSGAPATRSRGGPLSTHVDAVCREHPTTAAAAVNRHLGGGLIMKPTALTNRQRLHCHEMHRASLLGNRH